MKDFIAQPDGAIHSQACVTGRIRYDRLLRLARVNGLPMTLEDTTPDNAEAARLYLERQAAMIKGV